MGREIRRVKPGWEHPKYLPENVHLEWQRDAYHPLYDRDYESACAKWYAGAITFKPDQYSNWYHEDAGNPPDAEYYRSEKWEDGEATWFQMYETVSEGTPVTPAFATKKELIEYLIIHGDYWDQKRGAGGWSRTNAESFVKNERAPSMIAQNGIIAEPRTQGDLLTH
jgi:hypothetical protein